MTLLLSRTARQFNWTTGALLMVASAQLGWQACRASFPYCASPGNPYVYAQTSPDILKLVDKIEALARVSPDGHDLVVKVMSDHDSYWPLPWYLRRFTRVGYWNNIPPDPLAPIMIVSSVARPSSFRAARIMTGLGLPTLKALRPVAVSSIATIAPQPGRKPCAVGQLGSRFVAMSLLPRRIIRTAASTISILKVRPSPTTT